MIRWLAMTREPQAIWFDDVARRAGFSDAEAFATAFELKPYRLKQIYRAANKELLGTIDDVTTLPKELRAELTARGVTFSSVEPIVVQRSSDGQTTKGLFKLHDGNEVEAVLMEHFGD